MPPRMTATIWDGDRILARRTFVNCLRIVHHLRRRKGVPIVASVDSEESRGVLLVPICGYSDTKKQSQIPLPMRTRLTVVSQGHPQERVNARYQPKLRIHLHKALRLAQLHRPLKPMRNPNQRGKVAVCQHLRLRMMNAYP